MNPIHLTQGRSHSLHVEPGAWLVAMQGTVAIRAEPRWLADTVWRANVLVHAGQAHALDASGWVTLHTDDAIASVRYVAAPSRIGPHRFVSTLFALARRTFA
jgi:hypothetical protein